MFCEHRVENGTRVKCENMAQTSYTSMARYDMYATKHNPRNRSQPAYYRPRPSSSSDRERLQRTWGAVHLGRDQQIITHMTSSQLRI